MAHIITDAEAQSLVKIANSIIGSRVSQGFIPKKDMADAVQELLAEAVRRSDSYDENTDAEFTTYAHGVMEFQVFRVSRKLYSATTRMLTEAVPLDEILHAEDSDDAPDYSKSGPINSIFLHSDAHAAKKQDYLDSIRATIRTLPEEHQEICHLLMEGFGISEIAHKLKYSRPTIRIRIQFIKNAFIRAGISPKRKKI